MVRAVDLNDDASREATEVNDAAVEQNYLPAKPEALLAAIEPLPQSGFSGVVPLAHFTGMSAELERVVEVLRAG